MRCRFPFKVPAPSEINKTSVYVSVPKRYPVARPLSGPIRLDTVSFVRSNSTARPLPGAQPLSREFIVRHQRARLIAALAQEAAEKGYRAVTVADVVKRAEVGRKTFYENFGSKEDCLLAAQDHAMSTALERVARVAGPEQSWPARVCAGLSALLDCVVEEPALARTCMVEALAAGPASMRSYERSQQGFVTLLRLGRDVSPRGEQLPETLEEALIGGGYWIVYQRLVAHESETIPELLPELIEFVLTPYLGTESAQGIAREHDEECKKLAN
jgi:AcrR family transcriptional regulator